MSNKEFYVRHGLVVNNTVLTANVITGNVGIGTNNATHTLNVVGNANISLPQLFVGGTNVLAALNSSATISNAAYDSANSNWVVQNTIYSTVNAAYTMSNAAYDTVNAVYASSNSNWQVQNALYDLTNTVYASSNSNWVVQNVIYDLANTIYASSNSNWTVQNLVYSTTNAAYDAVNAVYTAANTEISKGFLRLSNSSTILDGATGNVWGGSFSSSLRTTWGGFYNSNNTTALFTFASGAGNVMSVQMDGSMFVGEGFVTDAMGVLPSYGGWIVAASGIKSAYNIYAGADMQAAGNVITGNYVQFADGLLQNTAYKQIIFDTANAAYILGNNVYASANSNWAVQNAIYNLANTIYGSSNSNWVVQNAIYDLANTIYASSNSNWTVQNSVYNIANTVYESTNSNWTVQNTIYDLANTIYNSTNSNWTVQNALYTVANAAFLRANALVNVGQTSPVSPVIGNLWWDTDVGKLFIYYTDADSSQWVEVEPSGTSGTINGSAANLSYATTTYNGANVSLASSSLSYLVPLNSISESSPDISFGVNNTIVFTQSKTYFMTYSIQYENDENSQNDIYVWFLKNGQAMADTSSAYTIPARKSAFISGKLIAASPIPITVAAGDTIQIATACPTGNSVTMVTYPATNNSLFIPRSPAVIVTLLEAS